MRYQFTKYLIDRLFFWMFAPIYIKFVANQNLLFMRKVFILLFIFWLYYSHLKHMEL